jgi:glycosyltransferase involved in cell wall biosynthesis
MNLLLVNYEYPPIGGGAGNATYFLANAFCRKGISTVVLTSSFADARGHTKENGVDVYRVPAFRRFVDRSGFIEKLAFAIIAGSRANQIVRTHGIERMMVFFTLPCGPVGYWVKRSQGIPYLVLLRGGDVPGWTDELDTIHRITKSIRRSILRNASAVIANDRGLARLSMDADPYPVDVIPNGVDTDYFVPASHHAKPDVFHILFVGRFAGQKNLFYLLDQYSKLTSAFPGKTILDMVGDGPQMQALKQHATGSYLEESVKWHGWVSKDRLKELYGIANCFVNPSLYEGMPNTVLEAMASGLPVVTSDVPGNNTLIQDGENGYIFDLKEPDACFHALARLIQNPEVAAKMGDRGRQKALDNYSWDSVAERFINLLS